MTDEKKLERCISTLHALLVWRKFCELAPHHVERLVRQTLDEIGRPVEDEKISRAVKAIRRIEEKHRSKDR